MRSCLSGFPDAASAAVGALSPAKHTPAPARPALLLTFRPQPMPLMQPLSGPRLSMPGQAGGVAGLPSLATLAAANATIVDVIPTLPSPMHAATLAGAVDPAIRQCMAEMPTAVTILQWGGSKGGVVLYSNRAAQLYYGLEGNTMEAITTHNLFNALFKVREDHDAAMMGHGGTHGARVQGGPQAHMSPA